MQCLKNVYRSGGVARGAALGALALGTWCAPAPADPLVSVISFSRTASGSTDASPNPQYSNGTGAYNINLNGCDQGGDNQSGGTLGTMTMDGCHFSSADSFTQ